MQQHREQDPGDNLDYEADYSRFLTEGDTVVQSEWEYSGPDVALNLTNQAIHTDAAHTFVWISGGTLGATYVVTNRITTDQGRELERSFRLTIVEK